MKSYLVSIEGGGTKSVFCFYNEQENEIFFENSSSIQARAQSSRTIINHISEVIKLKLNDNIAYVSGIIAALAGAGNTGIKKNLEYELTQHFNCPVIVMSDAEGAWNSCFSKLDLGLVSIHGTGSILIAPKNNCLYAFGGLGEGASELMSGRSLSKKALEFISSEINSGKYSLLSHLFIEKYSVNSRKELLNFIYNGIQNSSEVATLLAEAAENGCTIARQVIEFEKKAFCFFLNNITSYICEHTVLHLHGGLLNSLYLRSEIETSFKSVCNNVEIKRLPSVAKELAKRGMHTSFIYLNN